MRLACRLINGDGIGFEYAIVELTPDYVSHLLRLVDETENLTKTHETFCGIGFLDYEAEFGSSLGGLETDLPEFGEGRKWIEIPDDFEWPKDSQQSIASLTVVVTKDIIVCRALGSHDYCGPCYETDEMTVEKLRRLFPRQESHEDQSVATGKCVLCIPVEFDRDATDPEALACAFDRLLETAMSTPGILDEYGNPTIGLIYLGPDNEAAKCECQDPGYFHSGVPGILARVDNGRLVEGAKVERCDSCRRYPSDKAAFDKLVELGMAASQTAKQYVQDGGGFCPNCHSDQVEGNTIDFDGPHCTQSMRCLECHADWLDVYTLSNI